jgi:hypothetical protein
LVARKIRFNDINGLDCLAVDFERPINGGGQSGRLRVSARLSRLSISGRPDPSGLCLLGVYRDSASRLRFAQNAYFISSGEAIPTLDLNLGNNVPFTL